MLTRVSMLAGGQASSAVRTTFGSSICVRLLGSTFPVRLAALLSQAMMCPVTSRNKSTPCMVLAWSPSSSPGVRHTTMQPAACAPA